MLNLKEAVEQLSGYGISASEKDVIRWIEDGHMNAEINKQRRNTTYKLNIKDLTDFVIKKYADDFSKRMEASNREKRELEEKIDLIHTRLQIEQSKVRTLKKLLNSQIESSGPDIIHFSELLGLKQDSNSQSIKKEFKKLLKALHPDRGGDERLFKVFHEHYENLKS
ncbi:DnaJ domain-containing protein [Bacillus sp. REN3]|uniref:DnaJ domain-containing protein n=1 Tax=Bacillus sp. REN3 TaxID=2802440 RepID=UPI001FEFBE3C|nr:DnaJ domain-containing protein [Bacillus sp. REN3]